MAELRNDGGGLRFTLELVDQEAPAAGPRAGVGGQAARGRLLARTAVEYLDRRDGGWWPLARLPVLWIPSESAESLLESATSLLRGSAPGFAWQSGPDAEVGVQAGEGEGGVVVEVGMDLGGFIAESAGVPRRRATDLALFRFPTSVAELVRFADALRAEVEALRRP